MLLDQLGGARHAVDALCAVVYKATEQYSVLQQVKKAWEQAGDKKVLVEREGSLEWLERSCPALWNAIHKQPTSLLLSAQPAAQLLEEVAEVLSRGAQVLGSMDAALMPLTGVTNELLEVVMGLVVGLVRLALLLEGVPPLLLAKVMSAAGRMRAIEEAAPAGSLTRPSSNGGTHASMHSAGGGGGGPLPLNHQATMGRQGNPSSGPSYSQAAAAAAPTHPIFGSTSVMQYAQGVMVSLTPRLQQVLELVVTPALAAVSCPITLASCTLFDLQPAPRKSKPDAAGCETVSVQPHVQEQEQEDGHSAGGGELPAAMRLAALAAASEAARSLELYGPSIMCAGSGAGGSVEAGGLLPVGLPLNQEGLGGMTAAHTCEAVERLGVLRLWGVACVLACPQALLHHGSSQLVSALVRHELRMHVFRDRLAWLPLVLLQHVVLQVETLPMGPEDRMAGRSRSTGGGPRSDATVMATGSGLQAEVVAALRHALAHAASAHLALRSSIVQRLRTYTAAFKDDHTLLPANINIMLALLSLARYEALWAARHASYTLPMELLPHCGSAVAARAGRPHGTTPPLPRSSSLAVSGSALGDETATLPAGNALAGDTSGLQHHAKDVPGAGPGAVDLSLLELVDGMEGLGAVMVVQERGVRAALRAGAVAVLQGHLLQGAEALGTAVLAHPSHAAAVPPLKELVRCLADVVATDAPEDATQQLASARRTWLQLLMQLHQQHPEGGGRAAGTSTPPPPPVLAPGPLARARSLQMPASALGGTGMAAGGTGALRAYHLDQYAHSSHFVVSVVGCLRTCALMHEPPGLHARAACLAQLPAHHGPLLAELSRAALRSPTTAPLALAALKVLHWLPLAADSICCADTWERVAAGLAHSHITLITDTLQAIMAPLTQVHCSMVPEAAAARAMELCTAVASLGVVRVGSGTGVVPREYVRATLVNGLTTLLSNLAAAAAPPSVATNAQRSGGASTGADGKRESNGGEASAPQRWAPPSPRTIRTAIDRYLRATSLLHPCLRMDLQPNLVHALLSHAPPPVPASATATPPASTPASMGGAPTLWSAGGGSAAAPCEKGDGRGRLGSMARRGPSGAGPTNGCTATASSSSGATAAASQLMEHLAAWCLEHVVRARGVVFDPTLCAFLAPASCTAAAQHAAAPSGTKGSSGSGHISGQPAGSSRASETWQTWQGGVRCGGAGMRHELLSSAHLACLLEVLGPGAAQRLAACVQPVMSECVAGLGNALVVRGTQLLALDVARSTQQGSGVYGMAVRGLLADHMQAGLFSVCELSTVVSNARVLGRCLGFRALLGAAALQAAHSWAPYWARGMAALSIPHTLHAAPDVYAAATHSSVPSIGTEVASGGQVALVACGQHAGSMAAQAVADAAAAAAAGGPRVGSERCVTGMLQLPPPGVCQAGTHAVDPSLMQLLTVHVRVRGGLERWSLLPQLLALATSASVGGAAAGSAGGGEQGALEVVARCVQRGLAAACAEVVGGPGAPANLMSAGDWGLHVRELCGELLHAAGSGSSCSSGQGTGGSKAGGACSAGAPAACALQVVQSGEGGGSAGGGVGPWQRLGAWHAAFGQ